MPGSSASSTTRAAAAGAPQNSTSGMASAVARGPGARPRSSRASRLPKSATPSERPRPRTDTTAEVVAARSSGDAAFCATTTTFCISSPNPAPSTAIAAANRT
ncbi:hypothetical protein ACFQ0B_32260 [Nonomuraea thailandensis]